MAGTNPDTPTNTVEDYPDEVDDSRLVGVDAAGAPIYFDEHAETAYGANEGEDGWMTGEERASGPIADVVATIGDLTGWDALSSYGDDNRES